MRGATVKLYTLAPRLFKKSEAAFYTSRSPATFEAQCPVSPIRMPNGDKLWDVVDLDKWIDGLKGGHDATGDDIIARLG